VCNQCDLMKTEYPILLPRKGDILSERKNREQYNEMYKRVSNLFEMKLKTLLCTLWIKETLLTLILLTWRIW